jgi:GNAT superfamily N-acetyltransferase
MPGPTTKISPEFPLPLTFRCPDKSEVVAAYSILRDRHDWASAKGLDDDGPILAYSAFADRQDRGQNYCLFSGAEMVATICLKIEPTPVVYLPFMPSGDFWWLYALATRRSCAGRGFGAAIVTSAICWLDARGIRAVYLDCLTGNGFLPKFYQKLGFELLGQIMSDEGGEQLVEMNLLSKEWGGP